ncbi:MAG TPA: efflux RND transporter periplasmic adaptor subunit [Pirellulales bacterium]|nr:efflux RND transporter periplasmic adaptor subunit [Pirellulales bacterium]
MRSSLFCWAAILGAALAGCSKVVPAKVSEAPEAPSQPKTVAVTVAPVAVRPVQHRVEVVGTFHGLEEVTVGAKSAGRITRIHHDVGDTVAPGDVLLEIDDTDYRLAVEEAARSMDSELARLGLSQLPAGDVNVNELPSVVRTRLLADNAKRKYERVQSLRARNVSTQDEFDQAQTDYEVAEVNLQQAIIDARAALAVARHRQAVLHSMQQKVQDTRIVVPAAASGHTQVRFVVADRMVSEGEMTQSSPSTELFKLVIDDPLKLKITVPERHIGELELGQTTAIAVDAYPGQMFEGKISRINPTVDSVNRTAQLEVQVANAEHRLRPGNFAKVSIVTRHAAQAAMVPEEALVSFAGVNKVFVVRDGRAVAVEVETGTRADHWLEVSGALDARDSVVTSGYTQLADGTPVRIRTPEATQRQ